MPEKYRDKCIEETYCKDCYLSYQDFKEKGNREAALILLKRHRKYKKLWIKNHRRWYEETRAEHGDYWFVYSS